MLLSINKVPKAVRKLFSIGKQGRSKTAKTSTNLSIGNANRRIPSTRFFPTLARYDNKTMPLEIIPSIDLKDGQAVRLRKGDFATVAKVADDPVATARAFEEQGARRIHIVDLDGAKTGQGTNGAVIRAIIEAVTIPVQVGGGVRTIEAAQTLLDWGVNRVIVGTTAARDVSLIGQMLQTFGDRIVVGADMIDGFVAVHGWQEHTGEPVHDFGRRLVDLGARRFLITDVARDGLLEGPNVEATADFARAVGVPTLASGGVSGVHDISALVRVQPDGVEGVIIGKALYAGRLTLAEALEAASQ